MRTASAGRRILIHTVAAGAASLFLMACGGSTPMATAPSPQVTAANISGPSPGGFRSLTTKGTADLALCLRAPLPACVSAAAQTYLRIGTGALGAPLNLSSVVVGTTVTLSWTAPAGNVIGYVLEAGSNSGLANLANFATGSTLTTFTASNVPAGTYYVRVRALDTNANAGVPSNEVIVVIVGGCALPGTPAGLAITFNGGGTVGLAWNSAGGATSYVLEAGSAPGLANIASGDVGAVTTLTATGVAGGTYYVRVRGRNGCGISSPSNEVTIVVSAPARSIVSASIDGIPWNATVTMATLTDGHLDIVATNETRLRLIISLVLAQPATGVYSITSVGPSSATLLQLLVLSGGRPTPRWQTQSAPGVDGGSGSVAMTTITPTGASGTFFFTLSPVLETGATGIKSIVAGVFNVTF